jgi:hypothetical protein
MPNMSAAEIGLLHTTLLVQITNGLSLSQLSLTMVDLVTMLLLKQAQLLLCMLLLTINKTILLFPLKFLELSQPNGKGKQIIFNATEEPAGSTDFAQQT